MAVAVDQRCDLCGGSTLPAERGLHAQCAERENLAAAPEPPATGGPCDLCGAPTFPWEKGIHKMCANAENLLTDL